jgi:hypothetical protein
MIAACKHRWEPSEFGAKWWEPGTYQYWCARCNDMLMVRLGGASDAKAVDEGTPREPSDAAT